jgi:hypothetical protein
MALEGEYNVIISLDLWISANQKAWKYLSYNNIHWTVIFKKKLIFNYIEGFAYTHMCVCNFDPDQLIQFQNVISIVYKTSHMIELPWCGDCTQCVQMHMWPLFYIECISNLLESLRMDKHFVDQDSFKINIGLSTIQNNVDC